MVLPLKNKLLLILCCALLFSFFLFPEFVCISTDRQEHMYFLFGNYVVKINLLTTPCGLWDLSFLTMDQTLAPPSGAQSLNHWVVGELPMCAAFSSVLFVSFFLNKVTRIYCCVCVYIHTVVYLVCFHCFHWFLFFHLTIYLTEDSLSVSLYICLILINMFSDF